MLRGLIENAVVILVVLGLMAAFGKRRGGPGAGAAALILACLLPVFGLAAEVERPPAVSIPPAETSPFSIEWSGYALSGRLFVPGPEPTAFVGARLEAVARGPLGFFALGRADATTTAEGVTAEQVSFDQRDTFQSIEVTGAVFRPVLGPVGFALVYGVAVPFSGGEPQILDDHPERACACVMARVPGLLLTGGLGIDQSAGRGLKLVGGGQLHVKGQTHVGADGAMVNGWTARTFVLVRWGGSRQ